MISSDYADKPVNDIERSHLSNSPFYSMLAVFMPLSSLAAYILLLQTLIPADLNVFVLILGGGISAAAASFYSDLMKDVKGSRSAANVRGAVIITVFIYFFSSVFFKEREFRMRFIPNVMNIPSVLCALYTWISVIILKRLFTARRLFESITEKYEGEKLQEMLYEESSLLDYTDENIDKAKAGYYAQIVFIFIAALICVIIKIELPLLLYIHLVFLLGSGVCISALFSIIKWEQYYAAEGIKISGYDRIKRMLAVILISVSGLITAGVFSSDKSLIPFSVITRFFSWFFSLFNRTQAEVELPPSGVEFPVEGIGMDMLLFEGNAPSPLWEWFIKYASMFLKYALIAAGVILFIRFMIAPVLNKSGILKNLTLRQKIIFIIKEWYKGIVNAVASFLAHIKLNRSKKLPQYSDEDISRAANMIFSAYSPAKKRDVKASVTLFARLIIWGTNVRNITWKPSLAPREYCDILAAASPSAENIPLEKNDQLQKINEGIVKCAVLFEKALYSAEVLSDAEKKEFKSLIENITISAE